ncbi:MAG: hypothetical protein V4622_06390 [Bacteroidota bacterium]
MKNKISFYSLALILIVFLFVRFSYFENNEKNGYNATTWDAFGYYMFLPSEFIYDDVKELKWIPEIDSTYHVTGGLLYQACEIEDTKTYTNKYFCGVAIMESPFFFIGHTLAYLADEPQDGFSWPYQYAIMFAAIFWCFLGFIVLRKVLLKFFDDKITALTLLLIALSSNLIQYVSIDAGMSHAYIFPIYALVLYLTLSWHENPKWTSAFFIGLVCGFAMITRPTELIIIFIPILWATQTKEAKKAKWKMVFEHKKHILLCVLGGILALLPQLFYWKYTTESFMYDVGSKWVFFNPWFRVLFGPEKGWFLYTPIAIIMILGFFFMKNQPFKKAVLTFCLLNIWIIISWSDWKYGASYSTRALTQSYPVFALALASFIQYVFEKKKQNLLYALGILLIVLNFYQLNIYNKSILENFSPFLDLF